MELKLLNYIVVWAYIHVLHVYIFCCCVSQNLPSQLIMFSFNSLHAELQMHHCLDLASDHWFLKTYYIFVFIKKNWKIIAFQNFVVFCCTSTGISHRYTHVPSHPDLPPISLKQRYLQLWSVRVIGRNSGLAFFCFFTENVLYSRKDVWEFY